MNTRPVLIRFWEKVNKNGPTPIHAPQLGPCWLWIGAIGKGGYGNFWNGEHYVNAHLFAYTLAHGELAGLEPDHLCRVRACVRESHMEAVTHRENLLRGDTIASRNSTKTECKHGHRYTPENTYLRPDGRGRGCVTCRNSTKKARHA